jgi:hypothetical protein
MTYGTSQFHLDKHTGPDPYNRHSPPPPTIVTENPVETEWEVETLLRKRHRRRSIEYLVRWRNRAAAAAGTFQRGSLPNPDHRS